MGDKGPIGFAPPTPDGRSRQAMAWVAGRVNPELRQHSRWPFWVRHPLMALLLWVPYKVVALFLLVGFKGRRKLGPVYVGLFLWVTAALAGLHAGGWVTLAGVGVLGVPYAYWLAGMPFGDLTRDEHRTWARYGILGCYLTGILLTVAAASERFRLLVTMPGPFLLWSFVAGTAGGWWIRGEPNPVVVDAPSIDSRLEDWATRVAGPKRRLVGTFLRDPEQLEGGGWGATIDASATEFLTSDLVEMGGYIAGRFGIPPTSVIVEPHSSLRHDWAHLMVFPTNPLQQIQVFKGITLDPVTGWITVGTHTDGRSARWRLWVPGWGACHGLIFGTTGGGKSGLLKVIFTEARHSRLVCTFFGDPAAGESAPEWQETVTAFAGTMPRILEMLQGLERMMDARRSKSRRRVRIDHRGFRVRGSGKFTPTVEDPLLLAALDEFPDIANDPVYGPECLRIIGRICKQGRKFGVAIILLTQIPSLEEMGDSQAIRSMASGMNLAAFRTSDAMSASMGLPMALPIDPVNLPDKWPNGDLTAGLGFLARSDAPASPMRAFFQEDDDAVLWANTGDPAHLPEYLMEAGGEFFWSWLELLDLDDELDDVVGIDAKGEFIRSGESPSKTVAKAPSAETVWVKIERYLSDPERKFGATAKVIAEATDAKHNTVCTTLARYASEKYGNKCHEVPDREGMWRIGPAPVAAPVVEGDEGQLTAGNPGMRPHGWTAAKDEELIAS